MHRLHFPPFAEQIFAICKCLVNIRVCSVAVSSSFSPFVVTFLRLFACCCSPWMDNETSDPPGIDMWKAPLALFFSFIEAHPDWKRHSLSFRYFIVLFSHFVSLCSRQIEFHKEMLTFCPAEPFSNPSMLPPTINQRRAWNWRQRCVSRTHTCHYKAGTHHNNDTMVLLRASTEAFRFCLFIACWYYVLI